MAPPQPSKRMSSLKAADQLTGTSCHSTRDAVNVRFAVDETSKRTGSCPLSAQYRSLVMISSTPESSAGLCPRSRLERTGVLGSARLVRLWDERELSVEFPSFVGVARNPRSMPHVHPRGRRSGLLRVFSQCAHRLGPSANCRNAKNQDFSKTLVPIRFDECSIGFDQRRRAIFYRRRPSAMVHHA